MKALLIIDYTNDFVAPEGPLTAGESAEALAPRLVELADEFLANGDAVILPTDLHVPNDPYHPETKLYPAHNVADTPGSDYYGVLADWVAEHKDDDHVWIYPKNRYSSFANTDLDNYLRSRDIKDIHLTGVDTDICILHTAVDAYNLNYNITVHADGVASFTPTGHRWALWHFKNVLGATVTPDIDYNLD